MLSVKCFDIRAVNQSDVARDSYRDSSLYVVDHILALASVNCDAHKHFRIPQSQLPSSTTTLFHSRIIA